MDYGIEPEEIVTIEMVQKGHWIPGTLLDVTGQVFMVMGYTYWGWVHDCEDENLYYDVVLYHVGTGWQTSFPLSTILGYSTQLTEKNR